LSVLYSKYSMINLHELPCTICNRAAAWSYEKPTQHDVICSDCAEGIAHMTAYAGVEGTSYHEVIKAKWRGAGQSPCSEYETRQMIRLLEKRNGNS